jgi:hypothetical protein
MFGWSFISCVTASPSAGRARMRGAGTGRTEVVRADLEGLVAAHDEPDLARALVLEEADVARPSFLPLARVLVEAEELRAPAGGGQHARAARSAPRRTS